MSRRKRSIEIYLKEGIDEDDQLYGVWSALRKRGRPQDVFRRMLRAGLRAMIEAGELPRAAMAEVDPAMLVPPTMTEMFFGNAARRNGGQMQTVPARQSYGTDGASSRQNTAPYGADTVQSPKSPVNKASAPTAANEEEPVPPPVDEQKGTARLKGLM